MYVPTPIPASRGFSLIELAIVMAVVAVLLGTILSGVASFIQRSRFSEAEADIAQIKDAILGYTYTEGRLPCPDNDGDGIGGAADCDGVDVTIGFLPSVDLGVSPVDPWGNEFLYVVDNDFGDAPVGTQTSFDLDDSARLNIEDGNGNEIAGNVAFIVFSRGPDGGMELQDPFSNEVYISRTYSNNPADHYNDVIDWMSANVLKVKMVEAERLP